MISFPFVIVFIVFVCFHMMNCKSYLLVYSVHNGQLQYEYCIYAIFCRCLSIVNWLWFNRECTCFTEISTNWPNAKIEAFPIVSPPKSRQNSKCQSHTHSHTHIQYAPVMLVQRKTRITACSRFNHLNSKSTRHAIYNSRDNCLDEPFEISIWISTKFSKSCKTALLHILC